MAKKPKSLAKQLTKKTYLATEDAPEMVEWILDQVCVGRNLKDITKRKDSPTYHTVMRWIRDDPFFAKQYDAAIRVRALLGLETINYIATHATEETVRLSQLRIKAKQWEMERLRPDLFHATRSEEPTKEQVGRSAKIDLDDLEPAVRKQVRVVLEALMERARPRVIEGETG